MAEFLGTINSDTQIIKEFLGTIDSDSRIIKEFLGTIDSDAYITKETLNSDTQIIKEFLGTIDSDTQIIKEFLGTINSDAYITKETLNSDTQIIKEFLGTIDSDAIIFFDDKEFTLTSDAQIYADESIVYSRVVRGGQYINPYFTKVGTWPNGWKSIGADIDMPATVQAVRWEGAASGSYLQLRDATGNIFFEHYQVSGSMNFLTHPLTLKPPFQYFDSDGSNTIVIFGQFS